jgi:CheY-like chemotaxis protein
MNLNYLFYICMAADLKNVHALVADGDRNHRQIVRSLLNSFGIPLDQVRQCNNGKDAIELLEIRNSDFLITGFQMSPMNGLELVRALRHPDTTPAPGIPIIFCSRSLDQRMLIDALGAGANELIVKPINAGAIKRHITAVLERPRPLISLPNYIGPDRRRGYSGGTWDGVERRSGKDDFFID